VPVLNAGVSGDTTESATARLEPDVLSKDPRIVIIGLGGNDFLQGVPLSTTEAGLRAIVRKIQGAGAMVVVLGFTFPSLNANYDDMYARVAREEGCLLIPKLLKGILSDPRLKSDEIHPNAAGYDLMAERVSGPLRKLIRKAESKR
jgi:lysophospholipase L1-like esterase